MKRFRMALLGAVALVTGSQAEVLLLEGVNGYAGTKLATQAVRTDTLTGVWTGDANSIVPNGNMGMGYPLPMSALTPAGSGAFLFCYPVLSDNTGRSTGAALANTFPDSGTIYISLLGKIEPGAVGALKPDSYYAMGLTRTDSRAADASVARLEQDYGIWFGFGRDGEAACKPMVKIGNTCYPLLSDTWIHWVHLFHAKIEIGAGAEGKDRISLFCQRVDEFTGEVNYQYVIEENLNPATLEYLKVAGLCHTKSERVYFDEFRVATTYEEVIGLSEGFTVYSYNPTGVTASEATLSGRVIAYSDSHAGTQLVIDYRRNNEVDFTEEAVAEVTGAGRYTKTLTNLYGGFVYTYRFRLVKDGVTVSTSPERTFTTIGKPIVESWTLSQEQNGIHSAVSLTSVGENATLELLAGPKDGALEVVKTFTDVVAGQSYEFTWFGSDYSADYTLELRCRYPTEVGDVEMDPVQQSFAVLGVANWIGGTGARWMEALSWDIDVIPQAEIEASFNTEAELTETSAQSLVAKRLRVTAPATLDFGNSTLDAQGLWVGTPSVPGNLILRNVTLNLTADSPNANGSTDPKGIYLDKARNNTLTLAEGAIVNAGSVWMQRGTDNTGRKITVGQGAELTAQTIWLDNDKADFVVDGGKVTCTSLLRIGITRSSAGFRALVDNGGILDCSAASRIGLGTGWNATLRIQNGATATAKAINVGEGADMGGSNSITVSNATLNVTGRLALSPDARYNKNRLYVMQEGEINPTTVNIGGDLNVGAFHNNAAGGGSCHENLLSLAGGTVNVTGNLNVGGRAAKNTNNTVEVSLDTSLITASKLWMTNRSVLKMTLPAKGFRQTPIQCRTALQVFPDTSLVLDVTNFKAGRQQLISMPTTLGDGFDPTRVQIIPESRAGSIKFKQSDTAVWIEQPVGTVLLIR